VLTAQDGHAVGSDLVGDISVGGDAVCAHDHHVDLPPLHEVPGHVVADQSAGDVVLHQLPCGESGPLQEGTRLVDPDHVDLSCLVSGPDHSQGRSVVPRGQGASIAVGQDACVLGNQGGAMPSDISAHLLVLGGQGPGLLDQGPARGGNVRLALPGGLHPLQGPEQVDRRRPGGCQELGGFLQFTAQVGGLGGFGTQGGQGHPVGCCDSDGRSPTDLHRPDRLGHLTEGPGREPVHPPRKSGLVDHLDVVITPEDGAHRRLLGSGVALPSLFGGSFLPAGSGGSLPQAGLEEESHSEASRPSRWMFQKWPSW